MNNKKENKVLNKIKWIATRGIFIVAYIILLNVCVRIVRREQC